MKVCIIDCMNEFLFLVIELVTVNYSDLKAILPFFWQ